MQDFKSTTFYKVYWFSYVYLIPTLLLFHSIDWIFYKEFGISILQGDFILYSMKLTSVPLVLLSLKAFGFKPYLRKYNLTLMFFFIALLFFGLINPILNEDSINLFYYTSDFLGGVVLFLLILFFRFLIIDGKSSTSDLLSPILFSTRNIALVILIYAAYTGVEKVSVPPEIHMGLSLAVGLFFFEIHNLKLDYKSIFIIVAAAILSLMRVYIIIIGVVLFFGILNIISINKGSYKYKIRLLILVCIGLLLLFIFAGDIINERISSMNLVTTVENSSENDFFVDNSAETRIIEAQAILKEIDYKNLYFLIFGQGFGAEYQYFGSQKHHSHIAFISILFRNGLLGLFLLLYPLFYNIKGLFSKSSYIKLATITLLTTYLSLMTDQYIYYGLLFGLSVSLVSVPKNKLIKLIYV